MSSVPTVSIQAWRTGDDMCRRRIAAEVDRALCTTGFLLISDHGVSTDLAVAVRKEALAFFELPADTKERYAARVGGRGWIPPGAESNSYASGVAAPPDLKETFKVGNVEAPAAISSEVPPNVWPSELPDLQPIVQRYLDEVWALTLDMFELFACALGLPVDELAKHASREASSLNLNLYPSLLDTGPPAAGQFRIGAHSDFGVLTILDRQVGYGGLQIQSLDGVWLDAPHVAGALTVNVGDMLSRWTRGRWRSTMHRVLPPSDQDANEALLSLVSFCGVDPATLISPLAVDGPDNPKPVLAGDYVRSKLNSIDVLG